MFLLVRYGEKAEACGWTLRGFGGGTLVVAEFASQVIRLLLVAQKDLETSVSLCHVPKIYVLSIEHYN